MKQCVAVAQTPPHRTSGSIDPPARYRPHRDTAGIEAIPRNEIQSSKATRTFRLSVSQTTGVVERLSLNQRQL